MSITVRSAIINALTKVEDYITGLTECDLTFLNRESLQVQRDLVETLRRKYVVVQDDVILQAKEDAKAKETQDKVEFFQRCDYLIQELSQKMSRVQPAILEDKKESTDLSGLVKELIKQNQNLVAALQPNASTADKPSYVALPQIKLPTFSGKYSDWIPFKDRFKASVINHPTLSNVQKLEYLQNSVTGDAASTIKHLPTTEANYRVAWSLLLERFERKSEIISEHVRTFFDMPSATSSDPDAIQRVCNIFSESIYALDAIQVSNRDPWLVQYALDKLDVESRVLWGRECGRGAPTIEKFKVFLIQRCIDAKNASRPDIEDPTTSPRQHQQRSNPKKLNPANFHNSSDLCKCCNESSHQLFRCQKFLNMPPKERFETVKKLNLCRNCLSPHLTTSCTFHKCRRCQSRHNILLHDWFASDGSAHQMDPPTSPPVDPPQVQQNSQPFGPQQPVTLTAAAAQVSLQSTPKVFLPTAVVDILTVDGKKVPCRVMLDAGAQLNVMTTKLCRKLNIPTTPTDITLLGIGNQQNRLKFRVSSTIYSRTTDQMLNIDCYVMPEISRNVPNWVVDTNSIPIPPDVQLADPQWDTARPVDLLIGGDAFWDSFLPGKIILGQGLPQLRETIFGYIVVGNHEISPPTVQANMVVPSIGDQSRKNQDRHRTYSTHQGWNFPPAQTEMYDFCCAVAPEVPHQKRLPQEKDVWDIERDRPGIHCEVFNRGKSSMDSPTCKDSTISRERGKMTATLGLTQTSATPSRDSKPLRIVDYVGFLDG